MDVASHKLLLRTILNINKGRKEREKASDPRPTPKAATERKITRLTGSKWTIKVAPLTS